MEMERPAEELRIFYWGRKNNSTSSTPETCKTCTIDKNL